MPNIPSIWELGPRGTHVSGKSIELYLGSWPDLGCLVPTCPEPSRPHIGGSRSRRTHVTVKEAKPILALPQRAGCHRWYGTQSSGRLYRKREAVGLTFVPLTIPLAAQSVQLIHSWW